MRYLTYQSVKGAFSGSCRDSKNQNHCAQGQYGYRPCGWCDRTKRVARAHHGHVGPDVEVAGHLARRVSFPYLSSLCSTTHLPNPRRRLADPRVLHVPDARIVHHLRLERLAQSTARKRCHLRIRRRPRHRVRREGRERRRQSSRGGEESRESKQHVGGERAEGRRGPGSILICMPTDSLTIQRPHAALISAKRALVAKTARLHHGSALYTRSYRSSSRSRSSHLS